MTEEYNEEEYSSSIQILNNKTEDLSETNSKYISIERSLESLSSIVEKSSDHLNSIQLEELFAVFKEYCGHLSSPCRTKAMIGLGHMIKNKCILHLLHYDQYDEIIDVLISKTDDDFHVFKSYSGFEAIAQLVELYSLTDLQITRILEYTITSALFVKSSVLDLIFKMLLIISTNKSLSSPSCDRLIDFLLKYANSTHIDGFKYKSMEIIALLLSRGLITSHVKVNEIIVAMMNKVYQVDDGCRQRAVTVLFRIIELKQVPIAKFNPIFDIMIVKVSDKIIDIRKMAIDSLGLFVQSSSKFIDRNKIHKLYEVIASGCSDRHNAIRTASINTINWLAFSRLIPDDKQVNVVEIILDRIKTDCSDENSLKAISALGMLAQNNIIPIIKVNDVIDCLKAIISGGDATRKFLSVFTLNQLLKHRVVPIDHLVLVKGLVRSRSDSPKRTPVEELQQGRDGGTDCGYFDDQDPEYIGSKSEDGLPSNKINYINNSTASLSQRSKRLGMHTITSELKVSPRCSPQRNRHDSISNESVIFSSVSGLRKVYQRTSSPSLSTLQTSSFYQKQKQKGSTIDFSKSAPLVLKPTQRYSLRTSVSIGECVSPRSTFSKTEEIRSGPFSSKSVKDPAPFSNSKKQEKGRFLSVPALLSQSHCFNNINNSTSRDDDKKSERGSSRSGGSSSIKWKVQGSSHPPLSLTESKSSGSPRSRNKSKSFIGDSSPTVVSIASVSTSSTPFDADETTHQNIDRSSEIRTPKTFFDKLKPRQKALLVQSKTR